LKPDWFEWLSWGKCIVQNRRDLFSCVRESYTFSSQPIFSHLASLHCQVYLGFSLFSQISPFHYYLERWVWKYTTLPWCILMQTHLQDNCNSYFRGHFQGLCTTL
jgi:hypothetical protein